MTLPTTKTNSEEPLPVLRQIQGGQLKRELDFDLDTIDLEARTVVLSASSEYPVPRWFGMEVLDHSEASVDLTRLRNGAPFLMQHNSWSGQVGVVLEAWIEERRLKVKVKLSRSEQAEPIWIDLIDGIRRNVSIGYIPLEMVLERTEGNQEFYRVTRWEPFEVSSVSVPADPTVGLGRSYAATTNTIIVRGNTMQTNTPPAADPVAPDVRSQSTAPVVLGGDPLAAERQRSADIFGLGQRFNQPELAQEAIQKGYSADQVRGLILERTAPGAPVALPIGAPAGNARELPKFTEDVSARSLGLTPKEIGEFSLMRAMNAYAEKDWSKAGLEREVNIALADKLKKEARGFYVPHDLLMSGYRAGMSKGEAGKGGELVSTDLRLDQFVEILRNKTVMARLGMRMLGGLVGDLDIPKQVSGANFYWLGEGENVTESSLDLTSIGLTPKTIGGAVPITRRLRKQSAKSIESLVISDLLDGIAVAIDLAILTGSGTGNTPLGLLNQVGIPSMSYPAAGMDWASVVAMETKAASFNIDEGAYLTSVTQRGSAKSTQVFANTGERIWNANSEVNGHQALATNQMPADKWIYGDFSQIVCGLWGVLDLKPDPYGLAGSDGLILRVFQDLDIAFRRKEAFTIASKAAS